MSGPYYDTKSLMSIQDDCERYATSVKLFDETRRITAQDVSSDFKARGLVLRSTSEKIGTSPTGLMKALKSNLGMPVDALALFAALYFSKSTHEMMFGESAVTVLPKHLGYVAKYISEADTSTVNALYGKVVDIVKDDYLKGPASTMKVPELIRNRLAEVAGDQNVPPAMLFGPNSPGALKTTVKKYFVTEDHVGNLNTLMYFAMSLGTSLDYFCVNDYTAMTTIGYRSKNRIVPVTNQIAVDFIRKYLRLSPERKSEILKTVWLSKLEMSA